MLYYFRIVLLTCLGLIAAIGLLLTYQYRAQLPPSGISFIDQVPIEGAVLDPVVYISGAVEQPGIYNLSGGLRIADLITLAGGFTSKADSERISKQINLAEVLVDEQHVFIPAKDNPVASPVLSEVSNRLINVNTASSGELESLPGVGPVTASKIISGRPYSKIEDMLNVSGIGESLLSKISSYVAI